MRNLSIKSRLIAWLVLLLLLLSSVLLVSMLSINHAVMSQNAGSQLKQVLTENIAQTGVSEGRPELGENFQFYKNGVSTLIYSRSGSLLAGQIPVSFTMAEVPFQNGQIQRVEKGDIEYLVLDFWLPEGWENGLWIRGMIEEPDARQASNNLLNVILIALPAFIGLTALGGYLIVRHAFRPLDKISATALSINEGKDLSRRIQLPPGRDEFSRLAAVFDQLFARLEQSFEAEKQFTADVSHELRTPVSIIKSACEYGSKYDNTQEEYQETIAMIHRQAETVTKLITQMLSMTRLEQGIEQIQMETMDVGKLISRQMEESDWDLRRMTLDLEEGVMIQADSALLQRLAKNLIENAFKYNKPDGHVWVSVRKKDGECLLEVGDDGIGISPEDQDKIWQRFYQVDSARSEGGSSGLGLSMVQQIARIHHGYMTLKSRQGEGSLFTFHVPCDDRET